MTNTFSTTDLDLASALLACGFSVENIMPVRGKAQLYFLTSEIFDKTVAKYWEQTLELKPQLLFSAKKHLRAQINDLSSNSDDGL
jgi:hypothetical protein